MKQRSFLVFALTTTLLALFILAPQPQAAAAEPGQCQPSKHVDNLMSDQVLQQRQFHIDEAGTGMLTYTGRGQAAYASLTLEQDFSGAYSAARITEVDTALPPEARTRCWQPTEKFNVVAEFDIRFAQDEKPPGLTETAFLWNSPLGGATLLPMTAIGVSRSDAFGGYIANVSQNLNLATLVADHFELVPMPDWIDPTQWHSVRITLGQYDVLIEAAQGDSGYETVVSTTLPQPIDPLAFELSIDNEPFPGLTIPVAVPDTLEVDSFDIGYQNINRP